MKAEDRNKQRTAHYVKLWGVPKNIFEQSDLNGNSFSIMEFSPAHGSPAYRFVTNGLSEHSCGVDGGDLETRFELYCSSLGKPFWAIELLAALAKYVVENETYFAEFDTIPTEWAFGDIDLPYFGVLICPPDKTENQDVGIISNLGFESVLMYQVIGLHKQELDYAEEMGGEKVWKLIENAEGEKAIDGLRLSVM